MLKKLKPQRRRGSQSEDRARGTEPAVCTSYACSDPLPEVVGLTGGAGPIPKELGKEL